MSDILQYLSADHLIAKTGDPVFAMVDQSSVLTNELVTRITRTFREKEEERLQRLVAGGITMDRISHVTRAACPECRGRGWVSEQLSIDGHRKITMRECHKCPGLCVDGQPVVLWGADNG